MTSHINILNIVDSEVLARNRHPTYTVEHMDDFDVFFPIFKHVQ